MSADNWTTCPQCQQQRTKDLQEKNQEIKNSYGKVSEVEYHRLLREVDNMTSSKLPATLAENFDIGMTGWVFSVNYECHCRVCKYSFKFNHKEVER